MAPESASPSPGPSNGPANRHAPSAVEKQRMQLEKLLKDPAKPAYIPPPPKEKTIRPAREMMKNVQGSSAGAGSGEFHVYKASRRREYERLKLMEDTVKEETATKEFEEKKRKWEEESEARTAKNRAKRLKKKEKEKGKGKEKADGSNGNAPNDSTAPSSNATETPLKKRRLVNGAKIVFRKPGEDGESDAEEGESAANPAADVPESMVLPAPDLPVAETAKIIIHEDD
ncbi:DUF1168-domain-containing protein [Rickenella mellea]|uniref:DUF1168-domain-containing protein n=1 Tax=Rickenella mellea TaxID=50990 RepID=A0A4Y7QA24_9AGAM|nr:DUF1168-domain-containing protein [Rickenella mellea]